MSFARNLPLPILGLTLSFSALADDYLTNMMDIISPPQSQISVSIWDVETQQAVFNQNDNTLMLPASIQKLVTAVAASHQLGKEFHYKTQIAYYGNIVGNSLSGNLYIHFQGDPTLKRKHLNTLITTLRDKQVNKITGTVYLVAEESKQTRAPGWAWDDLGICYAAPVSNFIIDRNCVKATLKPAGNASSVSIKSIYPITMTSKAQFQPNIDVKSAQKNFCELHMQRFDNNHYEIDGCYPGKKPIRLAIAVNDPQLYSQAVIADLLAENGVSFQTIKTITNHQQQTVIATHQSENLPSLLKTMLQKSDNLIADSLLKQIGKKYFYQHQQKNRQPLPNTISNDGFMVGSKAIEHIMLELGLPFIEANIVDGSGLSRYNLITAKQMMTLLQLIKRDKNLSYIEGLLPVSGQSGTLRYKKYFNQPPLKNEVIAKTGTMMGVENLAGFINAANGKQYAFVIIENGLSPKAKKARLAPFSALLLQTLNDLPN